MYPQRPAELGNPGEIQTRLSLMMLSWVSPPGAKCPGATCRLVHGDGKGPAPPPDHAGHLRGHLPTSRGAGRVGEEMGSDP